MGLFTPKAEESDVRREVARLSGENRALRAVVALLLKHSPQRDEVLEDLSKHSGALSHSARDSHPMVRVGIEDTLVAIRRMA